MKKHRKWLIYFGTGMALNLLALCIFSSHISVTLASSLPLVFALTLLFEGLFDRRPNKYKYGFLKYNGKTESLELDESNRPSLQSRREIWIFDIKVGLSAIPVFMPFFFFFADWAKIAFPIAILLAALLFIVVFLFVSVRKDAKKERELLAKRLKEQQQREENGYWK